MSLLLLVRVRTALSECGGALGPSLIGTIIYRLRNGHATYDRRLDSRKLRGGIYQRAAFLLSRPYYNTFHRQSITSINFIFLYTSFRLLQDVFPSSPEVLFSISQDL